MAKKIGSLVVPMFLLLMFFLFPIDAGAIPMLGVTDTELLKTWDGSGHSFPFPGSGGITVWWGKDSGTVDPDVHVLIATTAGSGRTFTYGPTTITLDTVIDDKVDGYPGPPYWAADLGSLVSDSFWTPATLETAPALSAGGMKFYLLSGVFGGSLATGDWIFAMADLDKSGLVFDSGKDKFSPQTTSTTVVPEPSTLLLLGAGLTIIGLWGRKKFKQRS